MAQTNVQAFSGDVEVADSLTATNLIRGVVEEAVRWNSQNEGVFPQSASTRYYKIATLGTTGDGANGGKLRISGTIGGFGEDETTLIDAFVASRGGIRYGGTLTGHGGDDTGDVDFVVYLESDSTFSVWIKVIRFFAFDFTIMGGQVSNNTRTLTVLSCPTTDTSVTTPTGTLQGSVVDSCSVVFTDDGNVGIGTNAPGSALDVVGDVAISSNLAVDTNTLFVDSVGNKVGIGTNAPQEALHVAGSMRLGVAEGVDDDNFRRIVTTSPLEIHSNAEDLDGLGVSLNLRSGFSDSESNIEMLSSKSNSSFQYISFATATQERMRITSSGNVGIGTTNPQTKFHTYVDGGGLTNYLRVQNRQDNSGCGIEFMRSAGNTWGSTDFSDWRINNDAHLNFNVKYTNVDRNVLHLNINGNVGIGTDSPDVKLQVEGTSTSHRKLTKLATYNIFHHRDDLSFEHLITYSDSDGQAYYDNRDNFMYVQIPAFSGETLYTSTVSNYNASYFNARFRDLSGNKPDIPQNTFYKVHVYSSLIDAYGNITTRGNVGIGTTNPGCPLHIKFTTNAARNSGTRFEDANSSNYWENWINNGDYFYFAYNGSDRGWIQGPSGPDATKMPNFTGQHMTFIKDIPFNRATECEGLIVSSDQNKYIKMNGGIEAGSNAITTNESLPVVSLSVTTKDKKCFGVISASEDPETRTVLYGTWGSVAEKEKGDTRVYINSVGEGAIWVTNINGSLESGDYITTSNVAGYGQKQDSEFLANYTVAKITMDCDFDPVTQPIQNIKRELQDVNYWVKTTYENITEEEYSNLADENRRIVDDIYQQIKKEESKTEQEGYELEVRNELVNVLDEHGQIQWEDHPTETEKAYKIRYLDASGVETDETSAVHKAAFVGCTYHCG